MRATLQLAPTGERFNRLTVLGDREPFVRRDGRRTAIWRCRCDCGNEVDVRAYSLKVGKTKSCGCLNDEQRVITGRAKATHGATTGRAETREYVAWKAMIQRCEYAGASSYPQYGGRGIRVCEAWRRSFEKFFADMGPKPSAIHSMDRIDSTGNYEPGNCRWATRTEQNRNRASAVLSREKLAEIRALRETHGWGRDRIAGHLSLSVGIVRGALAGSWQR